MKGKNFLSIKGILIAAMIVAAIPISAQDSYREYVKSYLSGLRKFKNQRDSAFMEMLKQDWQHFKANNGTAPRQQPVPPEPYVIDKDTKPVDDKIPVTEPVKETPAASVVPQPDKLPEPAVTKPIVRKPTPETPAPEPKPVAPKPEVKPEPVPEVKPVAPEKKPEEKPAVIEPEKKPVTPKPVVTPAKPESKPDGGVKEIKSIGSGNCSVNFYGVKVSVPIPRDMYFTLSRIKEKDVAGAWEKLCSADYNSTINTFKQVKNGLRLNDYLYLQLVYQTAGAYYGKASNEATLFTLFAMIQSGYKVKVANINSRLTLMYSTGNQVYDVNFLEMDGDNYYVFDRESASSMTLTTYKGDFAPNLKPISFGFEQSPLLPHRDSGGKNHSYGSVMLSAKMNENMMAMYSSMPQVDYSVYKNAPVSSEMQRDALEPLRKAIAGMDELEAANYLLAFVQHGFDYKTDHQQFGRERPLFPDESLYYPYNDCEDRSMVFALWVKELLGLDVVILEYPNHAATAVRFSKEVKGSHVMFEGAKYVVCDPTCINAKVGVTMTQFRKTSPTVNPYRER